MISAKITGGEEVMARLKRVGVKTVANAISETERTSAEMENYSKDNRPWVDRTGNARRSIYAVAETGGQEIQIIHGIGVSYGVYLELSNGGKYRIIAPTVNRYRSIWLKNLSRILTD